MYCLEWTASEAYAELTVCQQISLGGEAYWVRALTEYLGAAEFRVLEAVQRSRILLATLTTKPSRTGAGHTRTIVGFSLIISLSWRERDSLTDGGALDWERAG